MTRFPVFYLPLPAARHFSRSKIPAFCFCSARLVFLLSLTVLDSSICSPFRYVDAKRLNTLGLIRFRTDFFWVIRVSVTDASLPWARRVSRRQWSRSSSECFLPYNSGPPQWTPVLDSLRLCDSRDAHRFASHDHGHVFLGTTARESAMPAFVCIFSYVGFGLAHPCRSGYVWCIRRTKFRVKFIYPL